VPVAAEVVAVVVAEVVPVSAAAEEAAEVVVEVVVAVVVWALLSLDRPTHRKVARYRLPQARQSICRGLDWCRRRLLPKLHRS
jgi:hypothetical protein